MHFRSERHSRFHSTAQARLRAINNQDWPYWIATSPPGARTHDPMLDIAPPLPLPNPRDHLPHSLAPYSRPSTDCHGQTPSALHLAPRRDGKSSAPSAAGHCRLSEGRSRVCLATAAGVRHERETCGMFISGPP